MYGGGEPSLPAALTMRAAHLFNTSRQGLFGMNQGRDECITWAAHLQEDTVELAGLEFMLKANTTQRMVRGENTRRMPQPNHAAPASQLLHLPSR